MLPYIYQYVVGGAVFKIGLDLAWKAGEVGLDSPRKRRRLAVFIGGFLFFAVVQGILQWKSLA